jgi:hypothetical protein
VFFAFPKSRANGKLEKRILFHNHIRQLCVFCNVFDACKNNDLYAMQARKSRGFFKLSRATTIV